jgi:hypothetical protein
LYCQLLFQYLDERTESGFHQQLANQNVPWDLDSWLQSALQSKVRPAGLQNALQVLSERPGLWKLLQDMLQPDPSRRLSSMEASKRWNKILNNSKTSLSSFVPDEAILTSNSDTKERDVDLYDGPYLLDVLESLEICEIPTIRPLHFVTSFDRSSSLGLYLSEVDGVNIAEMEPPVQEQWLRATADAVPGEVFVQDIIPAGQADRMGIFAIGDRLQGVGELPLVGGGFVRATELVRVFLFSKNKHRGPNYSRPKPKTNSPLQFLFFSETCISNGTIHTHKNRFKINRNRQNILRCTLIANPP